MDYLREYLSDGLTEVWRADYWVVHRAELRDRRTAGCLVDKTAGK